MRYVGVSIDRNEHLVIPRHVRPWEVPVLKLIHGDEKVTETGDDVVLDEEFPSAGNEFDRMGIRYGIHVPTETSYVVMVYGQAPRGVQALQDVIDKEIALEAKNAPQPEEDPTA